MDNASAFKSRVDRKRKRSEVDDVVPPDDDDDDEEESFRNDVGAPTVAEEEGEGEEKSKESRENGGGPPEDDCCPICFGDFSVPCRSNCGHWFCGSCILEYWNYAAASRPCKCPMCACSITKLTPEASLLRRVGGGQARDDVVKVLDGVERYNRLYVGGVRGLVQKVRESPLFIKRMFHQMMDPDRPDYYLHEMRLIAMILSILYAATPFDFIPTGGLGVFRLFDYAAIIVVFVLRIVGIIRRRRLTQRVRRLAAVQALGE